GGNRLDFGMLRYTDTAWMDDRTAPSAIVRHNLQGLYEVFPPAYLLSFALAAPGEPMHEAPDLTMYLRSRMAGALGLTVLPGELDEQDEATIADEVGLYKETADLLSRAAGVLLTDQVISSTPGWDAVESVTPNGTAVIFAYQHDSGVSRVTLKPQGLRRSRTYQVVSADSGPLGMATGDSLMSDGIQDVESPTSAAPVLFLQRAG